MARADWTTYLRCGISTLTTSFALFVVIYGIVINQSNFWTFVPPYLSLLVFIVTIVFLASLEGLQVCVVELSRHSGTAYRDSHPRAFAVHKLTSSDIRVNQFLVGRQVLVIFTVFVLAQLTTFPRMKHLPFSNNIEYPSWIKVPLLDTGLLGALVVLSFGQLAPQLLATSYPVKFMNLPFSEPIIRLCLFVEAIGVAHFCWVLKMATEKVGKVGPRVPLDHESGHGESELIESDLNLVVVNARELSSNAEGVKRRVPNFLLHVADPDHIPPHEVALHLVKLIEHTNDIKLINEMNRVLYVDKQ